MDGCVGWMNGWMDRKMDVLGGWMDGWMDHRMNGSVDGWIIG